MDNLTGMLYQDQPQIAGLPFDKDGLEANGCATTATNNVLQLMGRGVPYEQIYAWHRENGDSNFPGTIPWRTEQYIKDMVPDVNIRSAASLFGMVVPMEDKETLLRAQAQQVISEDGYGILCFTYSNPDGSIGAHYVAVESNPDHTIGVYDYDPNTGTAGPKPYKNVHDYIRRQKNGVLLSAWGLSPK